MSNFENKKTYVNRKERIGGLICVLLFFIIGAGVSSWNLVYQSGIENVFSRKNIVGAKMKRQLDFKYEQENSKPVYENLVNKIQNYNPKVNAIYEKNDIQFMINELYKKYEHNRMDRRYMVYLHLGDFYQMWFNDKQYLWSLQSNQISIKQNLEDCELGLSKKKKDIKSREK